MPAPPHCWQPTCPMLHGPCQPGACHPCRTAQVPHPLVKPICFTAHTRQPTWNMPHCCSYKEGFEGVDENFVPLDKGKGSHCYFQVGHGFQGLGFGATLCPGQGQGQPLLPGLLPGGLLLLLPLLLLLLLLLLPPPLLSPLLPPAPRADRRPRPCCLALLLQPKGKERGKHAGYQPRKRIQLSHFQRVSTESAVQKALRDHIFYSESPRNKTQSGTFDVTETLLKIADREEGAPVLPGSRALALLKARSQKVKAALRW